MLYGTKVEIFSQDTRVVQPASNPEEENPQRDQQQQRPESSSSEEENKKVYTALL